MTNPGGPRARVKTDADLFAFLGAHAIAHATVEHAPVFTVAEGETMKRALPGGHTKNLFLKDKAGQLWLVCALAHTKVDLKALPAAIGSARLSFGSPERLYEALGVTPGSVTVFALLNDEQGRVRLVLDAALLEAEPVNFHPLRNTATTAVSVEGLHAFLRAVDHRPTVVDLDALG